MENKKNFNLVITLVPQVLRFGYKLFKAWKSDGISNEEAVDLIEELYTILIFTFEEFDVKLSEEPEDEPEEVLEEEEGEYIGEEEEAVEEPVLPRKKMFKKRGK
jgi:hypothetical protein